MACRSCRLASTLGTFSLVAFSLLLDRELTSPEENSQSFDEADICRGDAGPEGLRRCPALPFELAHASWLHDAFALLQSEEVYD